MSVLHRNWDIGALCGLFMALGAPAAMAEPPPTRPAETPYLALGETPRERAKAERLARIYGEKTGLTLRSVAAGPAGLEGPLAVPAARLEVLREAERALVEARELGAQLREAAALRVLAQAEDALLDALEVPGVHAFLAEVYLQLALCAAQLGETGLFETDLGRALALDPRRRLEAAEAPPTVLTRARELGRAYDVLPLSEVAIVAEPAQALSTLDGAELGSGATRVRSGLHVLVVRAPGYAPYATMLKLEPGRHAPLHVRLAPLADEVARATLAGAAESLSTASAEASTLAQRLHAPVLLFETSTGVAERTLVYRCEEAGCALLSGSDGALQPRFRESAAAYSWLNADAVRKETSTAPKPRWKRWPLWTAGAVLVVAGVTAAIWASRAVPIHEQRELEIDPAAAPH